jgi:hypothetical protein
VKGEKKVVWYGIKKIRRGRKRKKWMWKKKKR